MDFPDQLRALIVTPQLELELHGTDPPTFSTMGVGALIRRFISGQLLSISQKRRPRKLFGRNADVDLERLEGPAEVWVLCFRKPRPGYRFVGRFLEKDVLVLFRCYHKDKIGNDYGIAIADITQEWETYFGNQRPCSGNWIDGYMSGAHYDVDQKTIIGGY